MNGALEGKVFNDRYKITERIGVGGMAEVYRAQDTVLGRTVAVKVMLPQFASSDDFQKRFKQEAASAANLSSPYIVNIYDWGNDNGTYYIVMELIRGTDLKSGIKARGALNQRKVAEIGSQVCSALSVAHKQDLIHRDIKPQNIMVQPDGNIKVMDFGIARAKNSVQTQTSSVLGTAHYISPEQAQGKELDGASDIYSLGIVLFEAATGHLPFDGPDAISVAMKQVNELPPYPSDFNPNIDPQLEDIIMKALEKNPRNRFASAGEMRQALNEYLAGRKSGAVRSKASQETAVLGAGAQGAVVRGGGIDQTAIMPPQATGNGGVTTIPATKGRSYRQNNALEEEEKKPGISRGVFIGIIAVLLVLCAVGAYAFGLFGGRAEIEVPDITGRTAAEATTILKEAGLTLGTTDRAYDSDAKDGEVIKQDPAKGTMVEKGAKVNVTVSLGAEQVIVPDLEKKTAAQAQEALTKAGLVARPGTAQYSADIEVNHVISQKPKAGETVAKGTEIEYILSLGAENIPVPSVVGYSQDGATNALTEASFKVDVKQEYSDTVSEGVVISQSPSGGKLEKGDTVTIVVSKGEDPAKKEVPIPSVLNMTVSDAKSTLEGAGFGMSVTSGPSDGSAIVASQSPTGTAVAGTTIQVTTKESSPAPSPTPAPGKNS